MEAPGKPQKINTFKIDKRTLAMIKNEVQEEGCTIVHCTYISKSKYINGGWVNIDPNTVLDKTDGFFDHLPLLHTVNIPVAPAKHYFSQKGEIKRFTLYFAAMPKTWTMFILIEIFNDQSGFVYHGIRKNNTGVYDVFLK